MRLQAPLLSAESIQEKPQKLGGIEKPHGPTPGVRRPALLCDRMLRLRSDEDPIDAREVNYGPNIRGGAKIDTDRLLFFCLLLVPRRT